MSGIFYSGRPEIWRHKNIFIWKYPEIAVLRVDNKMIAEFWGPIN